MADINTDYNPAFGDAVNQMIAAAKARGISVHTISGVRSREDQEQLYANYQAGKAGKPLPYPDRGAVPLAAAPGTSLHERGLAADIEADDPARQAELRSLGPQFGLKTIGASDPNHFEIAGGGGSSGGGGASGSFGTVINTANAPVTGALAAPKPNYTFNLPKDAPMGMGNNNPLNIKYYKGAEKDYAGLTGPSTNTDQGDPQMVFSSPEAGWNAAYNLLNKKYAGGKTTPNQIIAGEGGWTPGNKQAAANVAKAAGIGVDDDIGFGDSAKAAKFMRALVTQEQGSAGGAYPDEMIAGAIGGGGNAAVATTGTTAAPTAAPTDQSWWSKLTGSPTDAQGNPTGGKSPMQELSQAAISRLGAEGQTTKEEAPEKSALSGQGPGARNVSPGLANVAQVYGQTLNSFSQPLTWNSSPLTGAGMPAAGLQRAAAIPTPGLTLNTPQALPQDLGYGINPVGYGFG